MMCRCLVLCVGFIVTAIDSVHADGVRFEGQGETLFLNAMDVASTIAMKFEVVRPGELATFCSVGDGVCIPIRITPENSHASDGGLLIAADIVGKSLNVKVTHEENIVRVTKLPQTTDKVKNITAYNAAWGQGRGFQQGQTLPDIPLIDMDGQEVRFSKYLGKRYVLYCWASW